jgi:hypothetical protein
MPIRTLVRAILFVPGGSLFEPLIPISMFILINH